MSESARHGRLRLARGAALWTLLFSPTACRQVLDVDDYGTRDPDACDGVEYASLGCRDCVYAACCDEARACSVDPACRAMAQCLARCEYDDHECRGSCNLSIPRTRAMLDLVQCEATNCTECSSSRVVWGGALCDECVSQTCNGAMADLSRNLEALHLDLCERDCPEPPAPGCSCDSNPAARATLDAAVMCAAACGGCRPPVDWSCLGSVQWPAPAPALNQLVLHLGLLDARNFVSSWEEDFQVSACGFPALGCERPITTADGENGWADLTVNRVASSDSPEFFRYLLISGNSIGANALFYFFPPVRRSPAWVNRRLVSRAFAEMTAANLQGVVLDWEKQGGIVWSSTSCGGAPALGMAVDLDEGGQGRVFYYDESPAPLPMGTQTSSWGIGFITNVVPGDRTLVATVASSGEQVGVYRVVVQAGSITHVTIAPAPNGG